MFNSDAPITLAADDAINVWPFVTRLVNPLLRPPADESLVVGLYAPWGHGKTSALNLLARALEATAHQQQPPGAPKLGPQAVVVRFNPWLYASVDALLISFFETMAADLGGAQSVPARQRETLARALRGMGKFAGPALAVAGVAAGQPAGGGATTLLAGIGAAVGGAFSGAAEWFAGGEATFRKRRDEAAGVLRPPPRALRQPECSTAVWPHAPRE